MSASSVSSTAPGLKEPPFPLSDAEARAFIARSGYWYQNLYLGNGIWTMAGRAHHEDVWALFDKVLPASFGGLSVLDVATNAGYFALQAKLRGARHVVGTEFLDMYVEQAETIRKIWGVDIDYRKMDVHDTLKLDQTFDIIVFAGILYHLKNPLQVIEDLGKMCTDAILLETEFIPDDPRNCVVVRQGVPATLQPMHKGFMKFLETTELNGDPSNWWVPDMECVMGMLRTAGFIHISRPAVIHGVRLCLVASKKKNSVVRIADFGT
jgi:tRNA (mo5U34)-methyltransferase